MIGVRLAAVLGGLALAMSAFAAPPQVLVIQRPDPRAPEDSQPLKLDMIFAEVLDKQGRVVPVVWSDTDPLFRSYVDDKLVVGPMIGPTDDQVARTARNIGAKYVVTISATLIDEKLYPRAVMNQVGRGGTVWEYGTKDQEASQAVVVTIDGKPDWNATLQSVARTMNEQLNSGPWKDLIGKPLDPVEDPYREPPTTIVEGIIPPPIVDAAASKAVMEQAQGFITEGRVDMAILLLKDAVDLEPFEPKRRILLIELLSQQGFYEQAADEGRRAARLSVESADLWLAAARCWMLAGKPEEAKIDIQEALARGADGFLAQRLMGDIKMLSGNVSEAIDHYQKAIAFEDRFQARIGLALAFALSGEKEAALKTLAEAKVTQGTMTEENYSFTIDLIDLAARELAKKLSNLLPSIRVKGKEMVPATEEAERQATSLAEIVALLPAPELHARSHEERVLAHKLLSQSTLEMLAFVKNDDIDRGDEAVLSLAEATRILGNVRELYRTERTYGPQVIPPASE